MSHFASMSPPESDGSTPLFSRRRSDNFCDPVVMSGMAGSMRSSIPSRFLSLRSFSSQSMSFSVLSIFQTPLLSLDTCDDCAVIGVWGVGGGGREKRPEDQRRTLRFEPFPLPPTPHSPTPIYHLIKFAS